MTQGRGSFHTIAPVFSFPGELPPWLSPCHNPSKQLQQAIQSHINTTQTENMLILFKLSHWFMKGACCSIGNSSCNYVRKEHSHGIPIRKYNGYISKRPWRIWTFDYGVFMGVLLSHNQNEFFSVINWNMAFISGSLLDFWRLGET